MQVTSQDQTTKLELEDTYSHKEDLNQTTEVANTVSQL